MEYGNDPLGALIRQSVARAVREEWKAPPWPAEDGRKKILVLVPEPVVGLRKYLDELSKKHAGCLAFVCAPPDVWMEASDAIRRLDIRDETAQAQVMDHLCDFQRVYVAQPGFTLLDQTVRCAEESFTVRIVLAALLRKIDVVYSFDYNPFQTDGSVLFRKMEQLARSVRDLRIEVAFPGSDCRRPEIEKNVRDGLITQQDVDEMWKAGIREFRKGGGCIVTPLAKDRIRELGLRVLPV